MKAHAHGRSMSILVSPGLGQVFSIRQLARSGEPGMRLDGY